MLVTVVNKPWDVPSYLVNEAVLLNDNWNDYGFYTTFSLFVFDDQGKKHEMGLVQIAFKGQEDFQNTYSSGNPFRRLRQQLVRQRTGRGR